MFCYGSASAAHDRQLESSSRVASMTMDVMIPDEIKSALVSETTLDERKTNVENFVKFKADEETTKTVELSSHGDSVDVKVEPVLNTYMTNLVEYEARKTACPVKTEPVMDVDMTTVGKRAENFQYECAKDSKWDAGMVKRSGNETGNVRSVTIGEETDASMKCENGCAFPVKVKLEPGAGVKTSENQSRTSASVIYPVKIESELDLTADVTKDESEISVEGTETVKSHLYTDATMPAARWPKSTATENIPVDVLPNMYLPATSLVHRPGPSAVRLVPVKKVMDHQGNSIGKRLQSAKFVQNVPGVTPSAAESIAPVPTVLETSLRKTSDEYEAQPGFRNVCHVLSNMPGGMRSRAENQIKSQPKACSTPGRLLPHLPIDTDSACQVQSQTGLKRPVPVEIVQHMSAAETSMVNDEVGSSERKFIPGRIMTNLITDAAINNASAKRHVPLQTVTNASIPRNCDFQTQSIVQKQVKTSPGVTSSATISPNSVTNNEMFKFPIKMESELGLGTSTAIGSEEDISLASRKTVKMVGDFTESRKYGSNIKGGKLDPSKNPFWYNNALCDMYSTRKCVASEFDARYVCGPYASKALPSRVGSYSDTKIDDSSARKNMKQVFRMFPRMDEGHTESFNVVNEITAMDKLRTPSMDVSVMSPVNSVIRPKSFRKPRKEKLEVKKDVEFEIIPINALEEKNLKPPRGVSLSELEIPEMPPEAAAELTDIARAIKMSNKTAAELVREHGPRVKELWKSCSVALKKPGVKSKTNRRQEFKAWVMSAGEPGIYIMKTIARSIADYTRKRREKIKQLAQAGDPDALEVFSRVLANRRKFIERRRALREAGGPAAMAMAQRARDRERKRRARKALMKSGNCCHDSI